MENPNYSSNISRAIPDSVALVIHVLGLTFPLGYGVYHFVAGTLLIGVFLLMAAMAAMAALINLLKKRVQKRERAYYLYIYVTGLAIGLILTSYYYGYRGLVFLFPYTAGLFYLLNFERALISAITVSLIALAVALNVHDLITVLRYFSSLVLAVGFLACYAYVMDKQKHTLEQEAHYDYLTGITNRRQFSFWLDSVLSQKKSLRHRKLYGQGVHTKVALFYLDIDDFKCVNDSYGHAAGDELLKQFASRILDVVRHDDLIMATNKIYNFARLAGDEFVLAITDLDGVESAKKIAERLLTNAAMPFHLYCADLHINMSIGVAFSDVNMNADTLLHNADVAMYRAKETSKNMFYIYDDSISKEIVRQKDIEDSIVRALNNNHFELAYMPIYDVKQNTRIVGFEVLLRCYEPYFHEQRADKFISVAEASNLIKDIDQWVVSNAFERIASLNGDAKLGQLWCAINISSLELVDANFVGVIKSLVDSYGINPGKVHLEVTETKLIPYEKMVLQRLESLQALGFHLTLDDYGTGYTGFAQLLNFPGDYIKIDRSFIREISHEENRYTKMIGIIMSIAKICNLNVIAEGVETKEQLEYLKALDCQYIQGYYFSKPLSWEAFIDSVSRQ